MIKPGMAEQVFRDKYARFDGSSYETWNDVAERVSEGNGSLYNDPNFTDLLKGFMKDGVIATSGRHLQHGDRHQASKSGDRFVNCATAMTSFIQFWLLMQGCGVGRSYNNNMCPINWDNMPNVRLVLDIQHPDYEYWIEPLHEAKHLYNSESEQVRWFEVADSAEGWTKVIEALETAAFQEKHRDKLFIFDFSKVRAKNTPIRGMQNRPASGPVPFIRALVDVLKVKGAGLKPFKQAAIIDHYLAQAVLSGGVRRCLAGDSLVSTSCGMKRIDEVVVGDVVYTGSRNWKRVSATFDQGTQSCVRVSHQDGYIDCTPNHRLATLLPNGKDFTWKYATEILPGDRLAYFRHESNKTHVKLPGWTYTNPPNSTTSTNIIIPELTEDVAWLIGLVQGDGYVYLNKNGTKGHVTVACHEDDLPTINRCHKVMQEFGTVVVVRKKKNERCVLVHTFSNQLARYFQEHVKKPNVPLCVPKFIACSSTNIKMAYVTGILDSDGSIRTRPVNLVVSIYAGFVREIQSLLYTCGVETRMKKLCTHKGSTHKQKYSLCCITNSSKRRFSTINNTKHITETRVSVRANSFASVSEKLNRHFVRNSPVNVDAYERYINPTNDIVPLIVTNIAPIGTLPTYDIEVEDDHSFFANGVLSHNSARIACKSWEDNEQDVIEFITMKAGGQHYWSANNSIMVNDTFWNDVKANKSCKARRIFDAVISAAYYDNTGEPGFINADKLHEDRTGLDSLTPESYINPILMRKLDLHPKTLELFGKLISNLKKEKNLMIVNPCGEISLAMHGGYCTISDIVMANMPKDVNYASMVAITVAQFLLNVNKMTFLYDHEVQRTNRIGIGLTGIHEFAWNNFGFTFRDLLNEEKSKSFWDFLLKMRQNVELFVTTNDNIKNKPHTMFTIKPSGTISKIFSVTEGAHLPAYPAYIRWVQFRKDDPKVETLQRNGYLFKDVSHVIRDTVIIGFPTKNDLCDSMFQLGVPYTCAGDVTLEEQFTWIRLLEKYWLGEQYGNQVSYTAKYKPQDTSYDAFRKAIQTEQPTVKCCSVMPQVDTTAYVYQPEEEITLERYYELMKNITQDDEGLYDKSSLECAGGACPIEGDIR